MQESKRDSAEKREKERMQESKRDSAEKREKERMQEIEISVPRNG